MRNAVLLFALALYVCLLGCKKGMSEDEYGKAFASICTEYGNYAQSLNSKPSPIQPGMSKQAKIAAYSRAVNETGDKFGEFQKKEEALEAPPRFVGLHQQAIQFYKVQADGWHEWGDALAKDDRANAERLSEKVMNSTMEEMKKLAAEIQKLAAGDPELEKALREMQQGAA